MHIRLIAVGDRQPAWVDTAFKDYAGRLPRPWKFALQTIATSRRRRHGDSSGARSEECEKILGKLANGERVVMLDERGSQLGSTELASSINDWQSDGRDVCFVIGGPDGLDEHCMARADFTWSLSRLTLPHGLARVVCVEQLYRACTVLEGHPYHRA
ncbi:23S rRNA (pseudouridine(1915)-N(3))-methyltransferase RlmH [Woeseia oceani]|uniref:Ribosomal RNA large subunit methyltransferase H n=1 Tax=Woeseia oceani TaxID=1548547 RepID=A0A193LHK2_9GAMM|nr:23S rRNA (pseudouridine(1915)-N(3))-methyltransferase RlmH [Woeseia oceani]ANO51987.1 23S rRNA (pseudouridine(1915)-N(3))-methyltransferase RlmH [Woeseia oceani]